MRTHHELTERLKAYGDAEYVWTPYGSIAWHLSTGENIEALFLEAKPGYGRWMYRQMVEAIREDGGEPYHSVFAFRLTSNQKAKNFYAKMGWTQVDLGRSIYAGDETTLMWTTWDQLCDYVDHHGDPPLNTEHP
jgi:hypothetical protein